MVSPHRYSSHALLLLAMLFVTGCFAAASVMSLATETPEQPFHTDPTEMLARLDTLASIDPSAKAQVKNQLPPDVMKLLARIYAGEELDERELIDSYFVASGVFERRERDRYAAKLNAIAAGARKGIVAAKTPAERGDALLKFLHAGPMKAGYDAQQTRLSTLLDGGKFNCVSATALYQIVARRLKLDVHAISIPGGILAGHAMTIFVDGDRRIDVETTNPDGFDFQAKVKGSGGFVIGITLDPKDGHEVSELGLASLIAQNLASGRGKDKGKDYLAALQAALVGLALEPRENAKANNFVAVVNQWAMQLGEADRYEEALKVMQFGFDLVEDQETLKNNADILWNRYAVFKVKAGRAGEAVAVVRRGIECRQIEKPEDAEAAPFIHMANELADAKKWSDAASVLDQGLAVVEGQSTTTLREWVVQVHARWGEAERKEHNYDAAIAILAALVAKVGDDRDARNAIEYFAQESLGEVDRAGGPEAAARLLGQLRKEFSGIDSLNEAGKLCARRALDKLLAAKKYQEAAASLDRYKPLLADEQSLDELGGLIFDQWGRELSGKKDFEQAVKVYGDGLEQFRTSDLLQTNVVVAWDHWAGEAMKKKDWREAIRIYELALKALGDNSHLQHNLEVCRKKAK